MKSHGRLLAFAMAAAATLLVGCAEGTYVYRPAQQATAVVGSLPAARYAVPAERPTGEVLVASSGLTQMPEASGRTPALFVRMIVTNNSDDEPYVIDTAQQFAFIGGEKQSPAFVNTYKQAQPALEVPRGEKRLLDLYYRLPAKLDADDKVPQFDFAWSVQTSSRIVAERTSFDRTRVEPVYARGYYPYYGPGPYWWYDPWWPYPYYGVGIGVGVGYYRHYGHGYYGHGYYGGGYRGYGGGRGGYIRATPTRR